MDTAVSWSIFGLVCMVVVMLLFTAGVVGFVYLVSRKGGRSIWGIGSVLVAIAAFIGVLLIASWRQEVHQYSVLEMQQAEKIAEMRYERAQRTRDFDVINQWWANDSEPSADVNLYSSPESAAKRLAALHLEAIQNELGSESPKQIDVFQGSTISPFELNESIEAFISYLSYRIPDSQFRNRRSDDGLPQRENALRIDLGITSLSTYSNADQMETLEGTLRASLYESTGITNRDCQFADKKWLSSFGEFSEDEVDRRLLVAASEGTFSAPSIARRDAIRVAKETLDVDRLNNSQLASRIDLGQFQIDEFIQRETMPGGSHRWRSAVLLDLNHGWDSYSLSASGTTTSFSGSRLLGFLGMIMAIVILYGIVQGLLHGGARSYAAIMAVGVILLVVAGLFVS